MRQTLSVAQPESRQSLWHTTRAVAAPWGLRAFDVAVWLVTPQLLFSTVVLALVATAQLGLREVAPASAPSWPFLIPPEVSLGASAIYYLVPAIATARFVSKARLWGYFLLQPLYLAWSLPLAVSGFLFRRRKDWQHTEHG